MKRLYPIYVAGEFERNTGLEGIKKLIINFTDFSLLSKEAKFILRRVQEGKTVCIDNNIKIN